MFGFQMTLPSSRGMDTKALPFHFTAGHVNMGDDEFAIGSGNNQKWEVVIRETGFGSNSAYADLHLTYQLNVPQIKYQFYWTDGKSSGSTSQKYKSKSKDVH